MGLSKSKTRKRKIKGGMGELRGFPPCDSLSLFPITNEQIASFSRNIQSPMDCFINALQLLGVINNVTANIMRISSAGRNGFSQEEIEKIFILLTGHNHDFKAAPSSADFARWISMYLPPGNVVFAGHEGQSNHVYLIGRTVDGRISYIDPQLGTICDLSSQECQKLISNNALFRLMFNSTSKLTSDQLHTLGFTI
jgi:hypothetical protein